MQKKALAVAVSAALGAISAPFVAQAQNATVNIYGTLYGEYSVISHGNKSATEPYQNYDHWQNPGSNIGFRGEEKLGSGLSAWFQCESTIDYRGPGNRSATNAHQAGSFCTRDSALGLKGTFGNFYAGNWGTPFKRVTSDETGANDTGVFGVARLLYGTSSTFQIVAPNGPGGRAGPGVWRRRENNLVAYDTPNLAGFTGMAAFTARSNASSATSSQLKTRLWSIGGSYRNGPLSLNAAYEKHKDIYGVNGPGCPGATNNCLGSSENAWAFAASYMFPNKLKLGAQFSRQKADVNAVTGAQTRINTWHVGIDWMFYGPHGIRAAYSRAGNVTGTPGAVSGARPAAGPDTSAYLWQIRYVHMLSKRTELTAGFSRLENATNARYEIGGASNSVAPGSDAHAFALAMKHRF